MTRSHDRNLHAASAEVRVGDKHQRMHAFAPNGSECYVDLVCAASVEHMHFQAESARSRFHLSYV